MGRMIDVDKLGLTDFEIVMCSGDYKEALKMLIEKIENAPTVDAEPVRYGRWQVNEVNGYKDMTCLSCGWLFEYYDGLEEEWNYCPHCGAKMAECEAVLRWTKGEVDAEEIIIKHEDIGYEKGFRDGYAEALEVTDDAKRNGHWIENDTTYSNVTRQTCTCSVCGRHSPRPLGEFCRWCGAKMDEVEE